MNLAIITEYRGGGAMGSSIVARSGGASLRVRYPHEFDPEAAHRHAAQRMCDTRGWHGQFVTGFVKNGVYAHVFLK